MGRKKKALDYLEAIRKLYASGMRDSPPPNRVRNPEEDCLLPLDERCSQILGIVNNRKNKATEMMFFVMYDIESNKVRRYVVKYLEKKGCVRVQKSIFLANLESAIYQEIRNDLAEVQAAYDNNDSIFVVPISADYIRSMKIIGQRINVDVITHSKNTLFF